ncbi:WD domain, G-beta repeat protein [Onchocerca flexuosa]|uniref:WD domain, G-beta repeat protein n=1 Tax=Onchocerca flexuosa TaxID=387005 RepID=A0A238BZ26_9BILA|nr:WD domain, G-beta repeat protein [Onchocerca flexuosa]
METFETMLNVFSKETSYLVCFLGDRYGKCILPKKISNEQYQIIQATFSKASDEIELFHRYYKQLEEIESSDYKLLDVPVNLTDRNALTSILQQTAEKILQDGNNQQKSQNLFPSAAEQITQIALIQPNKVLFCLRTSKADIQSTNSEIKKTDNESEKRREKIEALKKTVLLSEAPIISLNMGSDTNDDNKSLFINRVNDNYIKRFIRQVTNHLQNFVSTLSMPPIQSNEAYLIANAENDVHLAFAESQLPKKWLVRENIDKMLDIWINQSKGYFHILGNQISGKTALLCQLHATLIKKDRYVITRFINLTSESEYAHELWHGICMTLCNLTGQDEKPLIKSFHLSSTLAIFKSLLEKLNRPVFILIDDVNMIKYGRLMSNLDQQFRKCLANLVLICTTDQPTTIPFIFPEPILFELPDFTTVDIMRYVKLNIDDNTLNKQQIDEIHNVAETSSNNIIMIQLLLKQITDGTNRPLTADIDEHFCRAESDNGVLFVQTLAQLLIVSPHGLTTLEILDALTISGEVFGEITAVSSLSLRLHSIIDKFGCLIVEFVYGNRLVYKWSHLFIRNLARQRYLTNQRESMRAHGLIVNLFADVNDTHSICSLLPSPNGIPTFPRPLKQDDGTVNTRKVQNLWYHLLYTATNSQFLNTMAEQAMSWVDRYHDRPLLVPLTCWLPPKKIERVLSFTLPEWRPSYTILQPTYNHQHLLIAGNESTIGLVYMYHITSQLLIRTFAGISMEEKKERFEIIISFHVIIYFRPNIISSTIILGHERRVTSISEKAIHVMKPHRGRVICSLITSDCKYIITGGTDSCANVISVENWEVVQSFKDHTGTVVSLALASNDEFLVTGSGEFVVIVWNLSTGELAVRLAGLMAPVSCITMTSNDAFVAVACEDETLKVFGTVSGQELHELSGHDGKVVSMAAAYDDCQLFVAAFAKIYVFDIHNGKILDILNCINRQPVTSLKITNDNYFLLSACAIVTDICMSPDEKSAACTTADGVVALWDLEICQCVCTMIQQRAVAVLRVKFSINSVFLLSGDAEGQINIWNSSNGKLKRIVSHHSRAIESIFCLSDGSRILSVDQSNIVLIWNLFGADESLQVDRILAFTGIQPPVFLVANNSHLVGYLPTSNKELRIWAVEDESVMMKAEICHNEKITCFNSSANGTLLVTGSADLSLKLWQINTGFLMQVLVGHEEVVMCCAIANNESIIISGAKDSQIIIWETSTGNALLSLKTESPVTALVINADTTVVISVAHGYASIFIIYHPRVTHTVPIYQCDFFISSLRLFKLGHDADILANSTGWIEAYNIEDGTLLSCFNAHSTAKKLIASTDCSRILLQLTDCSQLPILCLHNVPGSKLAGSSEYLKPNDYINQKASKQSNMSDGKNSSRVSTSKGKKNRPLSKTTDYSSPYRRATMQTVGKESAPLQSILKSKKSLSATPSVTVTTPSKSSSTKPINNSQSSSSYCPTKSNFCTVQ